MAIELTTATTEQLQGIRESLAFPLIHEIYPNATNRQFLSVSPSTIPFNFSTYGDLVNFKPLYNCKTIAVSNTVSSYINANELINLETLGTAPALNLQNCGFSQSTLDQLFTDLPATTKTATINVAGNPGAATCDPTIATNKGYTVVTS